MSDESFEPPSGPEPDPPFDVMEVDITKLPSAVLRRLTEEVRNESAETTLVTVDGYSRWCYSRFHNRHNRSR